MATPKEECIECDYPTDQECIHCGASVCDDCTDMHNEYDHPEEE